MEEAYKNFAGLYALDDERHPTTHVIMTKKEYENIKEKLRLAELATEKAKREGESGLRDAEILANRRQYALEQEIEKEKKNTASWRAEAEKYWKLNQNLLRIMKERANARRKMQPAKVQSGYRVIGKIRQKTIPFDRVFRKIWLITIETPYDWSLPLDCIKERICLDLFGNDWHGGLLAGNNLETISSYKSKGPAFGNYNDAVDENTRSDNNILFNMDFSYVPKKFWEVTLYTTKELNDLSL